MLQEIDVGFPPWQSQTPHSDCVGAERTTPVYISLPSVGADVLVHGLAVAINSEQYGGWPTKLLLLDDMIRHDSYSTTITVLVCCYCSGLLY